MKISWIAAATLFLVTPLAAQEPSTTGETIEVRRVLIDATVTDSAGNPIIGLGPDDFIVTEQGKQVPVESADYFTSRKLVRSDIGAQPVVDEVREERYFVLFFHHYPGMEGGLAQTMRIRRDALRWIEEDMLPGDRVAIVGHDIRMRVFADFTSDEKVLRDAMNKVGTMSEGVQARPAYAEGPSLFDTLNAREIRNDTGRIFDSLTLVADAVEPIRARKVMVLYSPGFSEGSLAADNPFMTPVLTSLNRANVQVWAAQIPGLALMPYQENLSRLALETGGEVLRTPVNYATPLTRADRANAGYYLLSYRSPAPPAEGEFRKVDVKLRNPEFKLTARSGYGG